MKYRITKILHNGTAEAKGTERTDGMYPDRKGQIVTVNFDNWHIGSRMIMPYLIEAGDVYNKFWGKALATSPVEAIYKRDDGSVELHTENSIYFFEKVGDL